MTEIRYSAERLVDAPADVVYHCIADYERGGGGRFDTVYTKSGPQGWIEKSLVARVLGPLYADELRRLERYAQAHGPLSACPGAARRAERVAQRAGRGASG